MDRTAEFRALIGLAARPLDKNDRPVGPFMRAAAEHQQRLVQLRRRLQIEAGQGNALQACKEEMSRCEGLGRLIEDLTGLAPAERRQTQQLFDHRRALISGLFEDMQNLASSVQSVQVNELQHEAEVAGYFCASSSSTAGHIKEAPPPILDTPAPWGAGSGETVGLPGDDSLDAERENMLTFFSNDMDQIQETQQKTQEVSALVTQFAMEVAKQQEIVENVTAMAEESIENVEKAEKHLQKAIKNSNSYRFWIVCWFVGSAIFLLVFDYLDSRMPI